MKAGIKTTEFWMPVIAAFLGLLVSLGLLTTELAEDVATAVVAAIPALAGLIGAVVLAVQYIKTRFDLKQQAAYLAGGELDEADYDIEPAE
jgi:fumarate reductase subunit D